MPGVIVLNYRYLLLLFCNWNIFCWPFDKITIVFVRDKIRNVGWSWSVFVVIIYGHLGLGGEKGQN